MTRVRRTARPPRRPLQLCEGEPLAATAAETPALLVRDGPRIHVIHDRGPHRGFLLSDGKLDGRVLTCTCHGSHFDVSDGSLLRGPATSAQRSLEARETGGAVEARLRNRG